MNVQINLLSIFIAGIVSMVVGFIWYSPLLFGNQWIKYSGFKLNSKKAKQEMGKTYMISFLVSFLTAFVLRNSSTYSGSYLNMFGFSLAITTAFWSWLGFVLPVQLTGWLFDKKPFNLFLINTGYQLVSLIGMAIVVVFI